VQLICFWVATKMCAAEQQTHCSTLQHYNTRADGTQVRVLGARTSFATQCDTMQHIATQCNTLQHTGAYGTKVRVLGARTSSLLYVDSKQR